MKRIVSAVLTAVFILTALTAYAQDTEVKRIKIGLSDTTMKHGEIQRLTVSVIPSDANPVLDYESDNPDVVIAGIGTLIANNEGVANITVKVRGTDIQDTVKVSVSNKKDNEETPDVQDIRVKEIIVQNKTIYLERDETDRIVYSVVLTDASSENIIFRSSNPAVATVDETGYVYANKSGNTTITLSTPDGSVTARVKVHVQEEYDITDRTSSIKNIYITYDDEIVKDKLEVMETTTLQLDTKAYPSSVSKKVNWRSSNKNIATVDSNGKVKGIKKGTCTIYATSTVNSSKRDSVKITVTDYVKYPEKIIITPQDDAVYETGKKVQFTSALYPEDTTETDVIWSVYGGAVISRTGLLTITDSGEIIVKAYSSDNKTVGEYKLNSFYSDNYFAYSGGAHNILNNRCIEMRFDADVSSYSALRNIFATCDAAGNGEKIKISVKTDGKKLLVSPMDKWPYGEVYIFIKSSLADKYGNMLGKNLKYKLTVRGNVYD